MSQIDENVPEATQQSQYNAPFAVNISFPEQVVIKMVDASALNDYEFGLFISSLLSSAFIGFVVAYFQAAATDPGKTTFGVVAVILGVMAGAFFCWALMKRRKMNSRSRGFSLKTANVEEIKD